MRDAFAKNLLSCARADSRIFFVTADLGIWVFDKFREEFPERFINVGVAEANMIGISAGLALSGKVPAAYSIAPFITTRCLDQIRMDICYHKLNAKLVSVGGGIVYGNQGPSHHGIEDIALMRGLPNMTVVCPADPSEAAKATKAIFELEGPAYLRLGCSGDPQILPEDAEFTLGKAVVLCEGEDVTLIATGAMVKNALEARDILQTRGISARVINVHTIKPIDVDVIAQAAEETKAIFTLEEHGVVGGLGSAVAEILAEQVGQKILFRRLGFQDTFCYEVGNQNYLQESHGISVKKITEAVVTTINRNSC